jgi:hypothetical protein
LNAISRGFMEIDADLKKPAIKSFYPFSLRPAVIRVDPRPDYLPVHWYEVGPGDKLTGNIGLTPLRASRVIVANVYPIPDH